jgi:hypothetical protein
MTDHQLSTRDLAARSDSDEVDRAHERQPPTEGNTDLRAAGDQDFGAESGASGASPTRERATHDDPAEIRPADTETDAAAEMGGEQPASDPGDSRVQDTRSTGVEAEHEPLFPNDQSERFTNRWQEIQTSFVDQPRDAVAEADALVADLMQRLAASFSQERERLEAQWDQGDDVSTEDLRVALTRYRSFFDRLLSA